MNSTKAIAQQNVKSYNIVRLITPMVFLWTVMTLFYANRGLSYAQIALVQTIGSVITIAIEIPFGRLSDQKGHAFVLRISGIAFCLAVGSLLVFHDFWGFIVTEALFSIAQSAESGAHTAIFYDSLLLLHQEEQYTSYLSKIKRRESIIRALSRLTAPYLFAMNASLPVALSLIPYALCLWFIWSYRDLRFMPLTEEEKKVFHRGQEEKEQESDSEASEETSEATSKQEKWYRLVRDNKVFIVLPFLSAILLILVSNYSQFLGNFLEDKGMPVRFLGYITASILFSSYLGTHLVEPFKKLKGYWGFVLPALLIALLTAVAGLAKGYGVGIAAYFLINLLHLPFNILLSDALNKQIESRNRATMLSISNQIDNILAVLCDPLIGLTIDNLGFSLTYLIAGIAGLVLFLTFGALATLKAKR